MRGRLFCLLLLLPTFGCQVGDVGGAAGSGSNGLPVPDCAGPLGPPQDPSTLPACCDDFVGGAHCVPDGAVPDSMHTLLAACTGGGYCVPDPFIETGGVYTPPACTSISGAQGVCLSGCVPQVKGYWTILPQDSCADDERCVPCTNPIDGTDTGACSIGYSCDGGGSGPDGGPTPAACPHQGPPVIDPSTLPACSPGAHCLADALVPTDMASRLAACPDGQSKCVPDELIAAGGNFIPPTCASVAGAEGRCLSTALPEVSSQSSLLPQSTCDADHLCVPCFNPLDGTDTGACHLSCDPGPTSGPTQLPACCSGRGTCVPTAAAGAEASQLGQDTCPDNQGLVCAPDVFLHGAYTPPSCTTGLIRVLFGDQFGPGACLPDCLPAVQNFLIGQDSCGDGEKCAPCLNPLTGQSSGACDPITP